MRIHVHTPFLEGEGSYAVHSCASHPMPCFASHAMQCPYDRVGLWEQFRPGVFPRRIAPCTQIFE